MADITPFIIRIQTALEKGGIEGAKTELAALTAETDKSKKANEGASGSSDKLGQSVGKAAELTGSLSAAMSAGGPQAQQLGAGLRVLKALVEGSTAGFMGLATIVVGAGVSAWVAYNNKVEESKKKIQEFKLQLQDNAREMQMSKLSEYAADIEKVRTALDNEADAYNRLSAARASMDSAEKASRLADITLKEKQAQFKLKPDDQVGAAKVGAEFAGKRRDLETEYQIKDATRAAEEKDHALSVSQEKLTLTEKKEADLARQLEKIKADVLRLSQEKVDLFGSKAPMKEDWRDAGAFSSKGGDFGDKPRQIVDEKEQRRRTDLIDNMLQGSKDGKVTGLTENFGTLSDSLAAIVIQKAKEKIEAEAKQLEADAALKNLTTANSMSPRINAADTALEGKNIAQVTKEQNLSKFNGRVDKTLSAAKNNADVRNREAALIDAEDFRRVGGQTYQDAKRIDKDRDRQAADAKRLLEAAEAAKKQIEAMDPAALTKVFNAMSRKFDQLDKAINDMDARAKRPGSGG